LTARGATLEVELGQPFRMAPGQQVAARGTELLLRKVGLVRREPAPGFESQGEEVILTLEARVGNAVKRRSFSWRVGDTGENLQGSWAVGDLVVHFDPLQLFTITAAEPLGPHSVPPRPAAATAASPDPGDVPLHAPPAPLQSVAPASLPEPVLAEERQLVRVRRKRKKRRRHPLEKLLDRVMTLLRELLLPSRPMVTATASAERTHRRRRHRSSTEETPLPPNQLTFEQKIGWYWSLTVLAEGRTLGTMRGANPMALVALVEDYLVAFGDPRPGFTLVLGNARTGRHVTVDRALVDAIRSDRADEILKSLDSSYPRHTPSRSGSTTVMVDETGLSINAVELLGRVFDPRKR
jgi:hypothetical protein